LCGGFLGGIARFFISGVIGRWIGQTFPWGTLIVNVTGAILIGAFAAIAAGHPEGVAGSELVRDFVVVGMLGGYTTVSSFSLQTLNLALDGEGVQATFNILGSASFCVAAVALGYYLSSWAAN
jgi:CrcB protein